MRKVLWLYILFCLSAFLVRVTPARAQAVASATIHGVVKDPSGAVIPNAQIKVTQTATGMTRTSASNSDGAYVLPDLPVGPYTLEVVATGFRPYGQSGIVLEVGNNVVLNVTLRVGQISQRVQVSANASMVQTQNTSVSEVIGARRVEDLPLNGRLLTQLVILSGAALNSPYTGDFVSSKGYQNSAVISVAGGMSNSNNYLLDGADNNDEMEAVNMPYPFPDAIAEFSVETNGLSARYGVRPGMVMNAVTKSGTDEFHGDLFEFVRNGSFNARNYFACCQDTLRRNQFGGTIGGPIKKGKLFFFFGYQSTRNRTAPATTISYVPTAAALNGDFSTILSASCESSHVAQTIINSQTGQPFVNDYVSPTLFNQVALKALKYIPVSSNPCGEVIYGISTPNDETQIPARVDWTISSKQSFFARYFVLDYNAPITFNGTDWLTGSGTALHQRSQAIVLGHTYSLSAITVNSIHASWTRFADTREPASNLPDLAPLGVNDFQLSNNVVGEGGVGMTVSNYFDVGGGTPGSFNRNAWQLADDVDTIHGKQQITFGGEIIHNQLNEWNLYQGDGDFTFSGELTGSPLVDYMLGLPSSFIQGGAEQADYRQNYLGAYAQDDVHLNSRLNFHVGLRWEPNLPEVSRIGRGSYFSLSDFKAGIKSSVYADSPLGLMFVGDPGIPKGYMYNSLADFDPRVGFAWDPTGSGKQTIRTSYSIFYDTAEDFYDERFDDAPPWASTVSISAPPGGLSNPWQGYPGGDPFPRPFPPSKDFVFPEEGVYINLPLNLRPTYTQEWDLSYQRQLRSNWLLSATYMGNRTVHIWGAYEEDPAVYIPGTCQAGQYGLTSPGPCSTEANTNERRRLYLLNPTAGAYYSTVSEAWDGDSGSYNALLLSAQHRFSKNYTVLFNYTYSHCLDDLDQVGELAAYTSYGQNPNDPTADYGNCDFDLRHNLNVSLVALTPTFKGTWANRLLGNWRLSPIISYHSGFWFNPSTGTDNSLTNDENDRPDLVTGVNPYVENTTTTREWLNPAAYVPNPLGTFGNVGRNSVVGPSYFDIDAGLSRFFQMPWRENQRLEVRFECFNVGNNVDFEYPGTSYATAPLNSPQFGIIEAAGSPRIFQFALKYYF